MLKLQGTYFHEHWAERGFWEASLWFDCFLALICDFIPFYNWWKWIIVLMMNCKRRGHKRERKKRKKRKEEGKKTWKGGRKRGRREGARKKGNGNLKNVQLLQLPGLCRNECALPASLVVKGMAAAAQRSHKHAINY